MAYRLSFKMNDKKELSDFPRTELAQNVLFLFHCRLDREYRNVEFIFKTMVRWNFYQDR